MPWNFNTSHFTHLPRFEREVFLGRCQWVVFVHTTDCLWHKVKDITVVDTPIAEACKANLGRVTGVKNSAFSLVISNSQNSALQLMSPHKIELSLECHSNIRDQLQGVVHEIWLLFRQEVNKDTPAKLQPNLSGRKSYFLAVESLNIVSKSRLVIPSPACWQGFILILRCVLLMFVQAL